LKRSIKTGRKDLCKAADDEKEKGRSRKADDEKMQNNRKDMN
jgi:hypothetical protein